MDANGVLLKRILNIVMENIKVGIVGHGENKFTPQGKVNAFFCLSSILNNKNISTMISGHSPVGGIDIWAEEVALKYNKTLELKIPKQHKWDALYGYKQRNLDIAKCCDELHVILVRNYPTNYKGMKFNYCYHCNTKEHIKSGACWTAKQAKKLGKLVIYHIIKNE